MTLALPGMFLVQAQGQSAPFWVTFGPILLIFAIFYFLLIMPQQKRQKKWQAMVEALKAGDKVVTGGGIRGTVISVKDDAVHLRVPPDNLRIEVVKSSVMQVMSSSEEAK